MRMAQATKVVLLAMLLAASEAQVKLEMTEGRFNFTKSEYGVGEVIVSRYNNTKNILSGTVTFYSNLNEAVSETLFYEKIGNKWNDRSSGRYIETVCKSLTNPMVKMLIDRTDFKKECPFDVPLTVTFYDSNFDTALIASAIPKSSTMSGIKFVTNIYIKEEVIYTGYGSFTYDYSDMYRKRKPTKN